VQRVLRKLNRKKSLSYPQKTVVTTTLYELIEAISQELQNEEKSLLPEIVINLLSTYKSNCSVQ